MIHPLHSQTVEEEPRPYSNRALLIGLLLFVFVGSATTGGFLLSISHGFFALAASTLVVALLVSLSE